MPIPTAPEEPIIKKPTIPEKKKVVPAEAVFSTKILDNNTMKNADIKPSEAQKSGSPLVA